MSTKKWEPIDRETEEGEQVFSMVDHVRNVWKPDLLEARIEAAWFIGRAPSSDGHLLLGRMRVYGELERRRRGADGEVQLNYDWWTWSENTDAARLALVHHELCHMGPKFGPSGGQMRDYAGELLWRKVRHDIEEFGAVAEAHGLWKGDLAAFAQRLLDGAEQMVIPGLETPDRRSVLEFKLRQLGGAA